MKYEYRVCDICGMNMDVNDYYVLKIDCKSKKTELKDDWKWLDCCDSCKSAVEKLIKERTKGNQIKFK